MRPSANTHKNLGHNGPLLKACQKNILNGHITWTQAHWNFRIAISLNFDWNVDLHMFLQLDRPNYTWIEAPLSIS